MLKVKSIFGFTEYPKCSFTPNDRLEVEVHYPFVGLLDSADRNKFYKRLCALMKNVTLHEKGVELTRTDRMLIAAPAIILSFGFKHFHWGRFKHVFVYPEAYKNKKTGNYHHGETSPIGSVVVSWRRVKEGLDNPDDALHLLYHEYAHALMLSRKGRYTREDRQFVRRINRHLEDFMRSREIQDSKLLRKYAFANPWEFFACTIEELMERADSLRDYHPKYYAFLIKLLNMEKYEDLLLQQASWYR